MELLTANELDETPQTKDDQQARKLPLASPQDNLQNKGDKDDKGIEQVETGMGE